MTDPIVRRRAGHITIIDPAVIEMRQRAAEPRLAGHATRRARVVEKAREMREEMGI